MTSRDDDERKRPATVSAGEQPTAASVPSSSAAAVDMPRSGGGSGTAANVSGIGVDRGVVLGGFGGGPATGAGNSAQMLPVYTGSSSNSGGGVGGGDAYSSGIARAMQQQADLFQLDRMTYYATNVPALTASNYLLTGQNNSTQQHLEAFLMMQQQQQQRNTDTSWNTNPLVAASLERQVNALSQQQQQSSPLLDPSFANLRSTTDQNALAAVLRYAQLVGHPTGNGQLGGGTVNNNNALLAAQLSAAAAAGSFPAAASVAAASSSSSRTQGAGNETAPGNRPLMLGIDEDQNWLSELQCFVRSEILEVVQATQRDVDIRNTSKSVHLNQVGIRCRWCANMQPGTKATRSSAYPSSIRQLYQSFTMMLRDHIEKCPEIPSALIVYYRQLKNQGQQGACDSKNYWMHSAKKLGMVDKQGGGIEITEESKAEAAKMPSFRTEEMTSSQDAAQPAALQMLVTPEDRSNITPFLYTLLTHVQLIHLLECEKLGKRRGLPVGLEGLGCKYCTRECRLGFSRNFPLRRKTLSTRVLEMYYHLRRCPLCPVQVKKELATLYGESQRSTDLEKEQVFYDMLWSRLNRTEDITV